MSGEVTLTVDGPVATVVIDNEAKRNALSLHMWPELHSCMDEADRDSGVRAIVLRGAGRQAFCAGGDFDDLAELTGDEGARLAFLRSVEDALAAIVQARAPVVAMLHGSTVGGGMAVACMCDLRIADAELRMGIPAARIGIVPSRTEVEAIVSLVGEARTAELFFTGRLLAAEEALCWGLVNAVVPADELEREAQALAVQIAGAAPRATRATKRMLVELRFAPGEVDIGPSVEALGGSEFSATLAAMREKRRPRFDDAE
jgi:enoyl-CoA hydratase